MAGTVLAGGLHGDLSLIQQSNHLNLFPLATTDISFSYQRTYAIPYFEVLYCIFCNGFLTESIATERKTG